MKVKRKYKIQLATHDVKHLLNLLIHSGIEEYTQRHLLYHL